jgi:Ca2+-binding RTX toxin-like protein
MRLALAILLSLVFAAPASASTAQVVFADSCGSDVACGKYDAGHPVPVVTYVAAAGEANRLTVGRAGDEWTLADPGAPITAAAGCRTGDAHTAVCTAASTSEAIPAFSAQLGDGDDTLAITGELRVLTSLDGGPGADSLRGGGDYDTLDGGPGADRIEGGGTDADVLSFAGRHEPVTVDLGAGTTSDGDTISGVEIVQGGDGADRLTGGPYGDTLSGGAGDDVLRGSAGRDVLEGGLGADNVQGGRGDDIAAGDPRQGDGYYTPRVHLSNDIVSGGPGDDVLRDFGGANRLEGGLGDDLLEGGSGPDRLDGGSGGDWLNGHRGADRLSGGAGRDEMRGGSGADRLSGGAGVDRLFGGSGPDRLLARDRSADRADCGRGRDRATIDAKDTVHACETLRPRGYTGSR